MFGELYELFNTPLSKEDKQLTIEQLLQKYNVISELKDTFTLEELLIIERAIRVNQEYLTVNDITGGLYDKLERLLNKVSYAIHKY